MKFRIGILAFSLFFSETTRSFAVAADLDPPASTATVLVWVRDNRGAPVPGLTAADFFISENGIQNRVLAVRNFPPAPGAAQATASTSTSKSGSGLSAAAPLLDEVADGRTPTQVLLIIIPMGLRGRRDSLRDAIRLLNKPVAADWRLALIDDEGTFIPFCPLRKRCEAFSKNWPHA